MKPLWRREEMVRSHHTVVFKEKRTKHRAVRANRSRPDTFWIELFDANNCSAIIDYNANDFLASFQVPAGGHLVQGGCCTCDEWYADVNLV